MFSNMAQHIKCAPFILISILLSTEASYNPFSDNIFFSIGWPGPVNLDTPNTAPTGTSTIVMTTPDQEQYKCFIPPEVNDSDKNEESTYEGPDEKELLTPLLLQTSCSYRIDNYWTYELCHGRFLRQYHEEKEAGKKLKVQQYFLGYGDISTAKEKTTPSPVTETEKKKHKKKVPLQKVEGLELPFYAIEFRGGTTCDLTGQPRRVSIHYVCQPDGKGEIYELKETSTCEYEMVVLTSLLCSHPSYQSKKDPVSQIQCHALPGSPKRPRSLDNLETETVQARYNPHEVRGVPKKATTTYQTDGDVAKRVSVDVTTNKLLIQEFLNGDYCVRGGIGWWKHELCLGKKVVQFHKEQDTKVDNIVLGTWNVQAHLDWLEKHPNKKPKALSQRRTISHFYGNGDVCDVTGQPRQVEVRLKCKDSQRSSDAVGIYLVESSTCVYLLVVESSILCPIIEKADDNGLVSHIKL